MVKSINIENYQSHKSTTLQFAPGVNVIVGQSDCGKSAILRALLWGVTNKPCGESFRSYWGGNTTVDIELENEIITREKSKENLYVISPEDGKPIEFKAFGTGIPEEVENILNISDINIQRQMDSSFLLSSTSGEVGRILNQAVKLDIIDIALKNINKTSKQAKNILENTQNVIENKQEELKKYEWLPEVKTNIEKLESISDQISKTSTQTANLTTVLSDVNVLDVLLKKNDLILIYSQQINDLIALDEDIEKQNKYYNQLIDLNDSIVILNSTLQNVKQTINYEKQINDLIKLEQKINTQNKLLVDFNKNTNNIKDNDKQINILSKIISAEKKVNNLIQTQSNYKELKIKYSIFVITLNDIEEIEEELQKKIKDISVSQRIFNKMMPNACPLCGKE